MNYAIFGQWVQDRVEELVSFGVSRAEAEHLMTGVELGAIADEARSLAPGVWERYEANAKAVLNA